MSPSVDNGTNETRRSRTRVSASASPAVSTTRIVTIAVIFCVFVIGSLYLFHRLEQFLIGDPRFALSGLEGEPSGVQVAGATHASRTQIERVFSIDLGRSVYLMPMSERRDTLRTVDWVKGATIARLWPNRVVVRVEERKPVAFITLASSKFALIDEDGVILPPAPDRFELPVLSGVTASNPIADRRDRVRRMVRMTKELGDNVRNISEIDVSDRDNLKVTVPRDGHIVTLLMGDHDFGRRYGIFLNHYGEIKRQLPKLATIDLRLDDRVTVVE